jgi:chromosome segregation ATPase
MLKNSLTVAELQTKLTELETKNSELTTAAESHASALIERDNKISELTTTVEAHVAAAATRDAKITELTGEIASQVTVLTEAKAKIVDLTGKITTVDAAADAKAREIAARNGAELPAKAHGAGDKTIENADTSGLTGMDKARAALAAKLPTK